VSPDQARTLSILDPTSLLGREVTEGIARAFPEMRRRLFHTGEEPEYLLAEVAGQAVMTAPLLDPAELDGSTAVVVTSHPAPDVAERLLAWMRANPAVAMVDCTQPGVGGDEAACVLNAPPRRRRGMPWYHLVDPALAAPARWLNALWSLAPEALHLTIVRSVSGFGAEALDELASQGAARLSGQPTRTPVHLPAVLAFDLAPLGGERLAALDSQLGELFPTLERHLHAIDAGVFHGHLATLQMRCETQVTLEKVRSLLRATPGFRLGRRNETVTARTATEGAAVVCGELQVQGPWVGAWLLADGLRVGGAEAVVELLGSLTAS
jgi:hypothetical protein